jgi:hypothetical protein
MQDANAQGYPAILYLHPHDLDSEELRVPLPDESLRVRVMRWGLNVGRSRNARRLAMLVDGRPFTTIREWLEAEQPLLELAASDSALP